MKEKAQGPIFQIHEYSFAKAHESGSSDSDREMIKVEGKKMKEKVQGPIVQVQEYNFAKAQESGSSYRYMSINDLYTRYR